MCSLVICQRFAKASASHMYVTYPSPCTQIDAQTQEILQQKRPAYITKETYLYHKRDLHGEALRVPMLRLKRFFNTRDLLVLQKRPICIGGRTLEL